MTTGCVLSRVGKQSAIILGMSVISLQVGQHLGYIKINFGKRSRIKELKKKAIRAAEDLGLSIENKSEVEKCLIEIKDLFLENISFGASFFGGILVGTAI